MARPPLNALYPLLACPVCRTPLAAGASELTCTQCRQRYPIVEGVPILLPPGHNPLPTDTALPVHDGYDDWIHRTVMESLLPDAVILEVGTGNMARSLPNVIRMDVTLTPHVDIVGDVHALPFLSSRLDFIFALAVIEHLRQPFLAAQEMHRALRPGGYVYAECSFIFPFHGHPAHYFNASHLGLAEIFHELAALRTGVGPHQMPSFALRALLQSYRFFLSPHADPDSARLTEHIDRVLAENLEGFNDRFSQESALCVAACTYYFGVKSPRTSAVIPAALLNAHRNSAALQVRFPQPLDLSNKDNLLVWARSDEAQADPAVARQLAAIRPFDKNGPAPLAPQPPALRPHWRQRIRRGVDLLTQRLARAANGGGPTWTMEEITDGGERVTHLFPNDCFVAHRSIYHFALPYCQNANVLDAGSGAGYGSAYLAERGARAVTGIDASNKAIAFSRQHFTHPNLNYEVMPIDRVHGLPDGAWDLIICSNVLEHVPAVGEFLRRVCGLLRSTGTFVLAVPPITNDELRQQNLANRYHLNIWSPRQWAETLGRYFAEVQAYQHWYDKPGVELNLINSPADTVIREEDFMFPPITVAQLYELPTITAIFTARRPLPVAEQPPAGSTITFVDDSFTRAPS